VPQFYRLQRSQVVPGRLAEVWAFFADPGNLARITPPDLHFVLARPAPAAMRDGQLLAYRLRPLFGVATPWVSAITEIEEGRSFVDEQVIGPYAYWRHEHVFTPVPSGVNVQDRVRYSLPFGVAGRLAHALIVKRRLGAIFDYRQRALAQHFGRTSQGERPLASGAFPAKRERSGGGSEPACGLAVSDDQ
jgi:ligand-binding SRPBCC domain-containing protein